MQKIPLKKNEFELVYLKMTMINQNQIRFIFSIMLIDPGASYPVLRRVWRAFSAQ